MTPDLVLLGNLLVDDLVFADGTTRMAQPGGAMLYASLAAALWGARAGCVSIRGDDYPEAALAELAARGVALDGVHAFGANGVRTWLVYEGAVRRVIHRLGGPSHEAVSPTPAHVPVSWRAARAFHLAPMPLAVQRALLEAIRAWETPGRPALVSLDPHVPVTAETLAEWRETLALADAFFPSDDEMRLRDATRDPAAALGSLVSGRLRFVAWKRGAAGGVLLDARARSLRAWPPRGPEVVDPTGAGDAFMAGFVTARLEGAPVEASLRRAMVSADLAIGGWGADGLLRATPARAAARLAAWDSTGVGS